MNTAKIIMPRDKALACAEQYRRDIESRADRATAADRDLLAGYEALARGNTLLDLYETFRTCPLDEAGRPKLAVAKASWKVCFYKPSFWNMRASFTGRTGKGISIPRHFLPAAAKDHQGGRALVPTIPLGFRPKDLTRYCILWECTWQPLPGDPLLLRRLTKNLFVILAQWDLTDLERSILRGTMGE